MICEDNIRQRFAEGEEPTREEIAYLFKTLRTVRESRNKLRYRLHMQHRVPMAYHHPEEGFQMVIEGLVPEGSTMLYCKPPQVEMTDQFRMKETVGKHLFRVDPNGLLTIKSRKHMTPLSFCRLALWSIVEIEKQFKETQNAAVEEVSTTEEI